MVEPRRDELDLRDAEATADAIARIKPSATFHLAALASVGRSWEAPQQTLIENVKLTSNLLEALRLHAEGSTLIHASSGEIYGAPRKLPVDENAPLEPRSPYAVSKAACDLLAGQNALAHGMRVMRMRPFNHCGPGQSDAYVVGSLTRQVAEGELAGATRISLEVGALHVARDFLDVRDVVRAYVSATRIEPGVYNVCSGRSTTIEKVIDELRSCTEAELVASSQESRLRPTDAQEVRGSADRLAQASGWSPAYELRQTLADAVAAWKAQLAQGSLDTGAASG